MKYRPRNLFLVLITAYFIVQAVLRVLISPAVGLDEAEQLILSQQARLGYGPQPPLYTWLQIGAFAVLGQNVAALAVLKNLLLLATYVLIYLGARAIARDSRVAVMAGASLLLLPAISWEAQRDLSHSVLLMAVVAASLLAWTKLLRTRQTRWYLAVGACAGLGFLAKYNYGLFLLPLVTAAMSVRPFRRAMFDRRSLLAGAVAAAILSPHLWWLVRHAAQVASGSVEFYGTVPDPPRFVILHAIGKFLAAAALFVAPLLMYDGVFFGRVLLTRRPHDDISAYETLLLRTLLVGLAAGLMLAVGFGVFVIKSRWLQPLLIVAPVYLAVRIRHEEAREARRLFGAVAALAAVVVCIAVPWRVLRPPADSRQPLNWPFAPLAQQLRQRGFHGGTIVADTKLIGGNLRLHFPDSVVAVPGLPLFSPGRNGDCLVIWNAADWPRPTRRLAAAARAMCGQVHWPAPQYIEAPLLHDHGPPLRLAYLYLRR